MFCCLLASHQNPNQEIQITQISHTRLWGPLRFVRFGGARPPYNPSSFLIHESTTPSLGSTGMSLDSIVHGHPTPLLHVGS